MMNRSGFPELRSYLVALAAVSLVFVAAQLFLNNFFIRPFWGRYLDWNVYREMSGKYWEKMEEAFSNPDEDAAFIIENVLLIDWAKSLTARIPGDRVEPPWSLSFAVMREDKNLAVLLLEIGFGRGDEGDYFLVIDKLGKERFQCTAEIFVEKDGKRKSAGQILFSGREILQGPPYKVRMDHDGQRLEFYFDGRTVGHISTVEALSRPRLLFTTHPSSAVLIDDVRFEGSGAGGEKSVIFEEDFDLIPLAVDLPSLARWDTDSRIFRTINLLAVLLAGILLDLFFFLHL